ncbi:pectinesterase family protein [Christiangramia crocea]|uniref:Pectinesterase n=1 Tax=Christiangramia crocea TaxID=2904124 RepID=A0A9X2A8F7_9FLAO|nr:pectinesterase family protein [Gramella crocea]MCG9972886.1 pectinesterase family protein [Gramella crocea]
MPLSPIKLKFIAFLQVLLISFTGWADQPANENTQQEYHFVVSKDGSGDFQHVQEAINATSDFRREETRILIKAGVYKEKIILPTSKTNVTFIGESRDETVLTYDDYAQKLNKYGEEIGTTGSTSFFIFGDGFKAYNLTFENSSGPVGQAVAVRLDGDKVIFVNCRFLGNQDTLYLHGRNSRQYYKDCYIEGTTDFIFGWSTAVFEDCEIYCKEGGHYITAASTEESSDYGFVFINCSITGDAPEESFYLGRPWRNHAQTVFINTEMTSLIKPEGWHNWNKPNAEETVFYAEYNSKGEGASKERIEWAKLLTAEEAKNFTVRKVLGGTDNWNPAKSIKN